MIKLSYLWFAIIALGLSILDLHAGGSGLNVVIVINQNSTNSVQLGNYYREQRNIPPQNVLRINWPGTNVNWTLANYNTVLLNPLLAMLSSRQLTNQIDYVVLSMDIPYRVDGDNTGNNENSTTSALFYGFKADTHPQCSLAPGSSNLYAGSEGIFRLTPPTSPNSNSFLVTMITQTNGTMSALALAEQIINQGIAGDSTFPTNTVWLGKSSDVDRNVRYSEFDNAVFNTRLRGNYSVQRTNTDYAYFSTTILGYENGTYYYDVSPVPLLVPGGFADSLTSFSGEIFEDTAGATTLLKFLNAGAAGSYGTIIEPCNYLQKFPDPQAYFYQSRGFSLAECYYLSLVCPYQGMVVGEPLSAPFAKPGTGSWIGLAGNTVLKAATNLSLQFTASDALHPLQRVELFVDGNWFQTLTNIAPQTSNVISVTLRGYTTNYIVTNNSTIASVTTGLVNTLNTASYTNLTRVNAFAHGDRVELQSVDSYTNLGAVFTLSAVSTNPSGPLTTFITPASSSLLDSVAWGLNSYEIDGTPNNTSTLQIAVTKTNNTLITVVVTNTANSNLTGFTRQFINAINASVALQGSDGLMAEDLVTGPSNSVQFNLQARGTGYAAAQIKASLTAPGFSILSNGNDSLTDNESDLTPRGHLYVTAGTSNLSFTFPFVTTNLPDGYHELTAVAYEGSHVRTQTRATQDIQIQNTPLSATLATLVGGSNSALEATLQFAVTPNTNTISRIELFSTGGSLGFVTSQPTATFSVVATNLGLGLHPFYAVVTDNSSRQYRTATTNIRLIGLESPFPLQIGVPPPVLVWPSTGGRSYDILTTSNLLNAFALHATVIATNSLTQWVETNVVPQQFYRVRVTP